MFLYLTVQDYVTVPSDPDGAGMIVGRQQIELVALNGRLVRAEIEAVRSRDDFARVKAEVVAQRQAAKVALEQAWECHRCAMDELAAARRELDERKPGNSLRRALLALRGLER